MVRQPCIDPHQRERISNHVPAPLSALTPKRISSTRYWIARSQNVVLQAFAPVCPSSGGDYAQVGARDEVGG